MDALDAIMQVMEEAFDPAYGEAWNRRQVGDALTMPNTFFLLAGADGNDPANPEEALGFVLSRKAVDEEELLLIAVAQQERGKGIGTSLMRRFVEAAKNRGANRLFLEMREGNPAQRLYLTNGFHSVGRRRNYYMTGKDGPFDAITYAKDCD